MTILGLQPRREFENYEEEFERFEEFEEFEMINSLIR